MSNLQLVEQQQQPEVIEYVPSVSVTLEQAAANLQKLNQIMRQVMREKIDYDRIPGTPKPTLLKPGAERLLQFFGLSHRVQCVEKITDWENGFFYFNYKVTVVKAYPQFGTEIVVAECEGSANSKEKRYRNQDVYSIVNTLQKMAIKRALVGATLQATGTSGFFTQDLEDFDFEPTPEPPKPTKNRRTQQQADTAPAQPAQPANDRAQYFEAFKQAVSNMAEAAPDPEEMKKKREDQLKRGRQKLAMLAKEKGLTSEERRAIIKHETGKNSSTELNLVELVDLVKLFTKHTSEELKEVAKAVLIAQKDMSSDEEALNQEINELLGAPKKTA